MGALEEALLSVYPEPDEIPESPEEQEAVRERFRIQDDHQALWALRKIRKIREEMAAKEALAQAEILRIRQWLEGERKALERRESFFTGLLAEYHSRLLAADPSHRTHRLPGGKLQWRAQQPEFERHEPTIIQWLKERGMTDYVEVVETLKWGEFKKTLAVAGGHAVTPDGEVVDGVKVIERPLKFSVVLDDDGGGGK